MNNKKTTYFLNTIYALVMLFFTISIFAEPITQLYIFGDSLSDMGNNGVYTNQGGPVWAQDLAQKFNLELFPSRFGGTNYAWSGAQTKGGLERSIYDEVNEAVHKNLDPRGLYIVWGGSNDILNLLFGMGNPPFVAASNIRDELIILHAHGARYLVVNNLPDIGKSPRFLGAPFQTSLSIQSSVFNSVLLFNVNNLDFDVIQLDTAGLFRHLLSNPTLYGFFANAATESCPTNDESCQGYIFSADRMHPTTQAHRLIADYVFSVLSAPNFYAHLAFMPLGVINNNNILISQHLSPTQFDCNHFGWSGFATGAYSPRVQITHVLQSEFNGTEQLADGMIGIEHCQRHSKWGVSYHYAKSQVDMKNDKGGFEGVSDSVSIFGDIFGGRWYLNGIGEKGWIQFHNVQRHFFLGSHEVYTSGHTHGNFYSIEVNSGILLNGSNNFNTGPTINIDYDRISSEGYAEQGGDPEDNVVFQPQHFTTVIPGLGWQANLYSQIKNVRITTHAYAKINKFLNDDNRDIHFRVATLPGSHGAFPVMNPSALFINGGLSINSTLPGGTIIGVSYNALLGEHSLKQQGVTGSLTFPLDGLM